MTLALEFVGAVLILVPFALLQAGRTTPHARAYLLLNLLGSGVLTAVAAVEHQWGFLILQAVWTVVALVGLVRPPCPSRPSGPSQDPGRAPAP